MYENAEYFTIPGDTAPSSIKVDINGETSFVPFDPNNTDYANITKMVEAGELAISGTKDAPKE